MKQAPAYYQFSDLKTKLSLAAKAFAERKTADRDELIRNAQRHVVNTHGKFYGLRSKYDGKGKLRTPVKA